MTKDYFESMQLLRKKLLDCKSIWSAVEVLTNDTGAECGRHLETLLFEEVAREITEEKKTMRYY